MQGIASRDCPESGDPHLCGGDKPRSCAHVGRDTAKLGGISGGPVPKREIFPQNVVRVPGVAEKVLGPASLGKEMKCEFCNSETARKKGRKSHWFKGSLYIVEDVVSQVCKECGERYFHATTLDEIDKKISGKHAIKELLSVEVLSA